MFRRTYFCIDLKSFFASVECVERNLDPMITNLVVADPDRSEKTICLAITPAMKALGIHNRCRIFEIPKGISYIVAPPRMQLYINYAAKVYATYLNYVSKDDIHVYSVDEAFLDVTCYISSLRLSPREMAAKILDSIFRETGIRAACGIGSNLYLAKIALDITAKQSEDFIGVLDEKSYAESMWSHKPLTDFWRIGKGTASKLARYGITTMGDIASADEDFLYRLFGIDAELLIDHAWGREPTTIADIKSYQSRSHSLTSGQVLMRDYSFSEAKTIVYEMTELMCLDMVDKGVMTDCISLCVGYSNSLHLDPAKGTTKLSCHSNADRTIIPTMIALYERIVSRDTPIRRLTIACSNIIPEQCTQLSLFEETDDSIKRSREIQRAMLSIKKRFGKNALFRALDLTEEATTLERNRQIGGHKSGE